MGEDVGKAALDSLQRKAEKQQERLQKQIERAAALRLMQGVGEGNTLRALDDTAGVGGELIVATEAGREMRRMVKAARPVMAKVKEVVEELVRAKAPVSVADILERLDYRLERDTELMEQLQRHPQVRILGEGEKKAQLRLVYQAKLDVRSRNELLNMLERLPEGVLLKDVQGAYDGVIDEVKSMHETGEVIVLRGSIARSVEGGGETEETPEIIFPGKHKLPIHVDADLVDLYRSIPLPRQLEGLEQELKMAGIARSNGASAVQEVLVNGRSDALAALQKRGGRSKRKRRNVELRTNAHLKGDVRFQGEAGGDGIG